MQTTKPIQTESMRPNNPEFIRLPRSGERCPYTQLTRSYMNTLILPSEINNWKPPVESFVLRNRGSKQGVRLISFDSLMEFINSQRQSARMEAKNVG